MTTRNDAPEGEQSKKPVHAKPALYAYYFEILKGIAKTYGYNLLLHGSLARDLDLVAVPWQESTGNSDEMVTEMCEVIGGRFLTQYNPEKKLVLWNWLPGARKSYVINLNREAMQVKSDEFIDPQYYIDISVVAHSARCEDLEAFEAVARTSIKMWQEKVENLSAEVERLKAAQQVARGFVERTAANYDLGYGQHTAGVSTGLRKALEILDRHLCPATDHSKQ